MLSKDLGFIWSAFWELSTDRQLGFGAEGRIPSKSIRSFAADHDLSQPDDYAWFLAIIREMDAEYLGMRAPGAKVLDEVPITDGKGITALLKRLAKKPTVEAG
jgi:hypothetical protein